MFRGDARRGGADANNQVEKFHGGRGGYGRYTYRYRHTGEAAPELQLLRELEEAGAGWSPLRGCLFGDDADRATAALKEVSQIASRISSERW